MGIKVVFSWKVKLEKLQSHNCYSYGNLTTPLYLNSETKDIGNICCNNWLWWEAWDHFSSDCLVIIGDFTPWLKQNFKGKIVLSPMFTISANANVCSVAKSWLYGEFKWIWQVHVNYSDFYKYVGGSVLCSMDSAVYVP